MDIFIYNSSLYVHSFARLHGVPVTGVVPSYHPTRQLDCVTGSWTLSLTALGQCWLLAEGF